MSAYYSSGNTKKAIIIIIALVLVLAAMLYFISTSGTKEKILSQEEIIQKQTEELNSLREEALANPLTEEEIKSQNKELERLNAKKVRAGVGKNRGRPYRKKKGPLIVVSANCNLSKSAKNIPGVDVCVVKDLNAELLAPGASVGRFTIFTEKAIEILEKEKLFFNKVKK